MARELDHSLMKKRTICATFFGVLIVSGFTSVSRTKAQQLATARFSQFCADIGYDHSAFAGPFRIKITGAAYAYEWRPKVGDGFHGLAGADGFRVEVMPDGQTQTAFPDQPRR